MSRAHRSVLAFVALASFASGTLAGELETYMLDPVHTRVVFTVEHAGFSKAMGTISGNTGTLRFDSDDWRSAQLDVTVPLTRLDLGNDKWNTAVLGSNLLDGKRYPEARFVSTTIEPVDADHAKVCGDLTLRGVTRPVCMDVTFNALKRHPLPPFRRTAGFSATATLSRKEFGIETWPTVIGDSVSLMIEAEAVRSRGDDDNAKPGAPEPEIVLPAESPPAEDDALPVEPDSPEPPSTEEQPKLPETP
jgi:polyisoprenoid-binding protein YceI